MRGPRSASPRCRPMPRWRSRGFSRSSEAERPMRAPNWLTVRPVAHRGLHDRARGIIENMPAAAAAAVAKNFAIECDIQLSADGEAMVHHDEALGRLTEGSGPLLGKSSAELKQITFK